MVVIRDFVRLEVVDFAEISGSRRWLSARWQPVWLGIFDRDDPHGIVLRQWRYRVQINCRYRHRQTHCLVKLRIETDGLAARLLQGARTEVGILMNHSMHSADRATHLKVLVIALISAIVVASLAITTHFVSNASGTTVRHESAITGTDRLTSSFPHS